MAQILSLKFGMCLLGLSLTVVVVIVHGAERSGLFEGISNFDGLSMTTAVDNKRRCSARCLGATCRGIHFDGGICKILYETNDIPESERTRFSPVTITSNEVNLLVNAYHACSSLSPCHHGGVCEAVDWIYQCNCVNTDHYGPLCETAGSAWTAPDGWNTLHPQLYLNLDDAASGTIYGGAMHLETQNGYGFEIEGTGGHYVDLGDWTGDTCFVDVKECAQGFTVLAYVNIMAASAPHFQGYISSMKTAPGQRYGAAIVGYSGNIWFHVYVNGDKYIAEATPDQLPTGWIKVMTIYKASVGAELYFDNVLKAQDTEAESDTTDTEGSGHITLGRYDNNGGPGALTVDWITIWDRPLSEQERNLAHLN